MPRDLLAKEPRDLLADANQFQTAATTQTQPEGFGAWLEGGMRNIPRQFGLTARSAIEGAGEFAGIFSNPIAYGAEKLTGEPMMTGGELGTYAADKLGLPAPETPMERVVSTGAKIMTPVGGQIAAAGKIPGAVAKVLTKAPVAQLAGAAGGGTAGQYAAETGGGPGAQFVAGMAGGFAGAAGAHGAQALARQVGSMWNTAARNLRNTGATIQQASAALDEILNANGVSIADISVQARQELLQEMRRSIDTGAEVDPIVLKRIADYARVGATPTRGNVTLDPVQLTQEKNLAKYGANSQDPNLQQLARTTRENDLRLTQNMNDLGADQALGKVETGRVIKQAMIDVDAPKKRAVDNAYKAVRDSQGRQANLDRVTFTNAANDALDEKQLGYFLPAEARAFLNDIAKGQNSRGVDVPFNVNILEQYDSVLSGLRRDLYRKGDTRGALAVQTLRKSLWDAPVESTAGEQAIQQYHKARQMAAARFRQIEDNPAMIDALDDFDPDKYVQDYIIGTGKKASVRYVANLARDLRQVPEAHQAARNQILDYLKDKALSGKADETANFSPAAFSRAMKAIGENKLRLFFNKADLDQLKTVGRVASYEKFQPTGSAVNNSNTTAMAMGIIERIAGNALVAKVPILRVMASLAADQARGQANKSGAVQALSPVFSQQIRQPVSRPPVYPLAFPAAMGQE